MLNKIKNRKQEGFTIIEVLIVLAIAGLIMLIVFLAVPQLQRNNRNTGRRSEAGRFATAASEFVTNANGELPDPANTADAASITSAAGDNIKYYTGGAKVVAQGTAAPTVLTEVHISVASKCKGTDTEPGENRSMTIQYLLEPNSPACQNI